MAHKVGAMKSFRIDTVIPGVGRVAVSSGTDSKTTLKEIKSMLRNLKKKGKLQSLRDIKNGDITCLEMLEHWESDKDTDSVAVRGKVALLTAFNSWMNDKAMTDNARASYRKALNLLVPESTSTKATIADLPELLKKRVKTLLAEKHIKAAVNTKTLCLSFVRATLGERSVIYKTISEDIEIPKYVKARKNVPLNVGELVELLKLAPADTADMLRTLFFTGMRPEEYFENGFDVVKGKAYIHVKGKKTPLSNRFVPYIVAPSLPTVGKRQGLARRLAKFDDTHELYDFRRSYAVLLEAAGIPRSRVAQYLGHVSASQTEDYLYTDIREALKDDASKVREYVETQLAGQAQPVTFSLAGHGVMTMLPMSESEPVSEATRRLVFGG